MADNKRRKKYLGTALQNKLLFLIFAATIIPAAIVGVCVYYLIFNLLALQLVIPEVIAANLMPVLHKVNIIMSVALPLILLAVFVVSMELSHRIAGPVYRMEKELDERIAGTKSGPIKLRPKDELKELVEKINRLMCK
jgi:signal transduction histidine kinase